MMALSQFAALVGKTPETARIWVNQGRIRALQVGTYWKVSYEEYERYQREGLKPKGTFIN